MDKIYYQGVVYFNSNDRVESPLFDTRQELEGWVEMIHRTQQKENYCPNCRRMLPGGFIQVDDVNNPYCVDCGEPVLSHPKEDNE